MHKICHEQNKDNIDNMDMEDRGAPTYRNANYGTPIITEHKTRTLQHTYQQKCTSAPPLQHEKVDKPNRDRVE